MEKTSDCHLNIKTGLITVPSDFQAIEEEKFKIDRKTEKELESLYFENSNSKFILKTNDEKQEDTVKFSQKINDINEALDIIETHIKEDPANLENEFNDLNIINEEKILYKHLKNYTYYNLEDIEYNDENTLKSAYDFLHSLEKKAEIEIEDKPSKPIFKKPENRNKIKEEANISDLKKKISLLSFQDE